MPPKPPLDIIATTSPSLHFGREMVDDRVGVGEGHGGFALQFDVADKLVDIEHLAELAGL